MPNSGLYGIEHSNRKPNQHWSKNCFNSSFPAALANYMMVHDKPAVYAKLALVDGKLKVVCSKISINRVFNCGSKKPSDLEFDFESKYEPYEKYSPTGIDSIDLVVKDLHGNYLAPIECKLTALPTSATSVLPENKWGCEIVYRSPTTSYCALSIWDRVKSYKTDIREIFDKSCSDVSSASWTNDFVMKSKTKDFCDSLNNFEEKYYDYQMPLVMQTIWKTKGQSPFLSDECLDVVVWSNLAFSRLFIDSAIAQTAKKTPKSMSRPMRASARMARCLWELSRADTINLKDIYREMAFGNQTDKEASIPGDRWRRYIDSERITHPTYPSSIIGDIIDEDRLDLLKPERRLDQSLYLTAVINNIIKP